ncbi:response regulator [Paenibacillus typhae]|uniref:Two component transcriptional regulator, AraC family n=1 Tax=Paenibacillus typhae TaxID=1174501 RepID=A0A1G8IJ71_9BACL|nr:response regulator [Paenibacillus typhae]SDI18986.1 two component transcriptional regulator, AraC family [Paenibacillus typhae]
MYKVMIVDDEPVIKKGLQCFIDWSVLECEVVCEASNGIEAVELLDYYEIDIIVTDIRMPGMDGLALSDYVHRNSPQIKVIILTAFADFSYAQTAIQYEVVDFVVKTNPTEQIPRAIEKATRLLEKEREQMQKVRQLESKLNDNLSEISEKFLKEVLGGLISDELSLLSRSRELGLELKNYFGVYMEVKEIPGPQANSSAKTNEYHRFLASIRHFLVLAFGERPSYIMPMEKNTLLALVSMDGSNASVSTQTLLTISNEILAMAENFRQYHVNVGISLFHRDVLSLREAYLEAREALQGSFYNDNYVAVYMPYTGKALTPGAPPHHAAEQIAGHLQQGHSELAIQQLDQLLENYRSTKEPIENVKVACLLIGSYCFRLLSTSTPFAPEIEESQSAVYKQIQESTSIQLLTDILKRLIQSCSRAMAQNDIQPNYIVIECQKYIRENYNQNLNLQIIADHIHINSSYLSRLYKKVTGESIIDVINKYRIEMAKKLLRNPASKVFEVAEAVGIETPAYFTHVFSKYTGMSPKEYKLNYSQTELG